ncbi:DUF4865 family protein [Streptomyces sp. NPDC054784]
MHAMQYEITLPADYDMGVIRDRVATRGHLLDGAPGLGLKAYAVRERGRDGSPVNEYAPFYLWDDPAALTGFLRGPGFDALSGDFGRPSVRDWHTVAREHGSARAEPPNRAERTVRTLRPDTPLDPQLTEATEALRRTARADGVHTAALGLDPYRWELVRFVLRSGPPAPDADGGDRPYGAPDAPTERYTVLHLSEGTPRPPG